MITYCLEVDRTIIYIYDSENDKLAAKTMSGLSTDVFSIDKNAGLVGYVFGSGHPLLLKNPYEDKRFDRSLDKFRRSITKNILMVPIKLNKDPIGCIGKF
jgi:hypothetical protein